jgi:hypothetical protein
MRLSDAIAMGRALVTSRRGTLGDGASGCVLAMAVAGAGLHFTKDTNHKATYAELREKFPVLCAGTKSPIYPDLTTKAEVEAAIVDVFDNHVMAVPQDWTLDQLIDWVRKTEDKLGFGDPVAEVATETATVEVAQ